MSRSEDEITSGDLVSLHQKVEDQAAYIDVLMSRLELHESESRQLMASMLARLRKVEASKYYRIATQYWKIRAKIMRLLWVMKAKSSSVLSTPTNSPPFATPNELDLPATYIETDALAGETPNHDSPPLPPHDMMFRVVGAADEFFWVGGQMTEADIRETLNGLGYSYADFDDIYDFGCGCGRVLYWIQQHAVNSRIYGSDIDIPAVIWAHRNLPGVNVRINNYVPPLPFRAGAFDLIVSVSVFSHLDENYQDAWLAELHRVSRPGALLLLSVHGAAAWSTAVSNASELLSYMEEFQQRGFIYSDDDFWEGHFLSFYRSSFHLPHYVRQHWSQWFTVLAVIEGRIRPMQDLVVLRRL